MSHQRQQIREAVVTALTGATSAGARVFETRMGPPRQVELPAVAVYTDNETVDAASQATAPRVLMRNLELAIEGWVTASADVDDALDSLALQIERAMHADDSLGGKCMDLFLQSTDIAIAQTGERPMGAVRLLYTVTYETYAPEADDVELDDFSTANITYEPNGAEDEATDILEGLED